ncbi:AraC family transcriptional regulator [Nitrospirillum sp. BR 11164]|uniref:AraC family transcriptional regulator n=1 Tax=Nitrospirillum sp. BR 11164 TaxID=3104324 RepID=UPI002AFDF830|nr:AraC family transcriptional regulator [Nitrospirillum sp. BR 11164]MEA1648025.1 AraC family transcriptional regulator [Nitrospirillum sp. BR 11164]
MLQSSQDVDLTCVRESDISFRGIEGHRVARLASLAINAREALNSDLSAVREYLEEMAMVLGINRNASDDVELMPVALDVKDPPLKGGLTPKQIRQVVEYIEKSLATTIMIKELSRVCRLSTSYFARAFKVTMGDAPRDFITKRRIRRAQVLMLTTNDTLSAIACACGFSDQSHFSRLFRKMVGETPLRWRRTWKREEDVRPPLNGLPEESITMKAA